MAIDVKVPVVGESVQEAMIQSWKKKSGDWVERDEVLCDLETDKATVEIVAPNSGKLELLVEAGQVVKVGTLIAKIDEKASPSVAKPTADAATAKVEVPKAEAAKTETAKKSSNIENLDHGPAVSRLLSEKQITASQVLQGVEPTGKGGRLSKEDVLGYAQSLPGSQSTPVIKTVSNSASKVPTSMAERAVERKPMSMLRRRIAERLVHAQQTAAILTTFNEIDMTAVTELRKKYKDVFEKKHNVKLGFMGFFLKAAVAALQQFPDVNAFIEGDDIIYHHYCDIGVAVSTERGLMVPVIRNVEKMSIVDIEKQIAAYAEKARQNKISIDDLSGGTFTVSNGGVFGSLLSTPILNPPQSAILGMHKTEMRPIVMPDGKIEARGMMYVAMSYDHRIIDGKEAVGFLVKVKENIEDPSRLLLGV